MTAESATHRFAPERALVHPVWLAALLVLAINDHVLKEAFAGVITGKLSDVAGMFVAPALLAMLLPWRNRRTWTLSHAAVGVVFAAIKLSPWANSSWEALIGNITPFACMVVLDPTDLVALPFLAVSWWVLGRAAQSDGVPRRLAWLWLAPGLVFSLATSAPQTGQVYSSIPARATLVNELPNSVVVRVRTLSPDWFGGCDNVLQGAAEALARSYFSDAKVQVLAPKAVFPLDGFTEGSECPALLLDGDGLPLILVTWSAKALPVKSVPAHADGGYGQEAIVITAGMADSPSFSSAAPFFRFAPPPPEPAPPAENCAVGSSEVAIDWSTPVPEGDWRLVASSVFAGGCVALELEPLDPEASVGRPTEPRWYVCGPEPALEFEAGQPLSISSSREGQVELVSVAQSGQQLELARGPELASALRDRFLVVEGAECAPHHEPECESYVKPLRLSQSNAGSIHAANPAEPIAAGDDSVYFVRGHKVLLGLETCAGTSEPTQVLETARVVK